MDCLFTYSPGGIEFARKRLTCSATGTRVNKNEIRLGGGGALRFYEPTRRRGGRNLETNNRNTPKRFKTVFTTSRIARRPEYKYVLKALIYPVCSTTR